MIPQSLFLSLFFTLISSPLCFSRFHDDPSPNFLYQTPGHDPTPYPTFFGTIDDNKDDDFESSFTSLQMENEAEILSLAAYDHEGSFSAAYEEVSVDDLGAKGDGVTDDTEAFMKAWEQICVSNLGVLIVPQNKKYLLKPITFTGPCKYFFVVIKILGTIIASNNTADYAADKSRWIMFYNVNNLIVEGPGLINGNGEAWWKTSCKINTSEPCLEAATAVTFYQCSNLQVYGLNVLNPQQMHVRFEHSVNVYAYNITVNAPGSSPNTVGIHVIGSENVFVAHSVIKTGDDCISIINGSANIEFNDVECGPGYGIRIGSFGGGNQAEYVNDVMVSQATLTGTMNGVRIMTSQGGSGDAENIVFEHINMNNVGNPILINQEGSTVQVRNVVYNDIKGTIASPVAITFNCSNNYPCKGIQLQDINLKYKMNHSVKSTYINVKALKSTSRVSL